MSYNCQDNKCKRSSQSTIIINIGVVAFEDLNVMGERFWRDFSSINHTSGYIGTYLFISLVDIESITNILVSSCKEKSFLSSRIFFIYDLRTLEFLA